MTAVNKRLNSGDLKTSATVNYASWNNSIFFDLVTASHKYTISFDYNDGKITMKLDDSTIKTIGCI